MKLFKIYVDNRRVGLKWGEIHLGFDTEDSAINWIISNNQVALGYPGNPTYEFGSELC